MKYNTDYRNLIPPISSEEYQLLEESILNEGCREAIVTWNDCVLDGHNRYKICQKHNIGFKVLEKKFDNEEEAKTWIIHNQLARRNLPPHERARLALMLKPTIEEKAKERMLAGKKHPTLNSEQGTVLKQVGKIAGVSEDTVRKVEAIEKEAPPEIKEAARKGKISVNKAYKHVRGKDKDQAKIKAKSKPSLMGTVSGDSWKLQEMKSSGYKIQNQWAELSKADKKKFIAWIGKRYESDSVFGILLEAHIIKPEHPTFTKRKEVKRWTRKR